MIAILNVGRASMVIWIVYGLTLIFAPNFLHRGPDDAWGIAQVTIAFGLGYVIERAMSAVHRRRAAIEVLPQQGDSAATVFGSNELTRQHTDPPPTGDVAAAAQPFDDHTAPIIAEVPLPGSRESTTHCPFCAEPILVAAIKCKHCSSDLGSGPRHSAGAAATPTADFEWAILGAPVAGVALMWGWIGRMPSLDTPTNLVPLVSTAVILLTAILCAHEASKLGMRRDKVNGSYSPFEWGVSVLLLWLIAYPMYLYKRRNFGVSNRLLSGILVAFIFLASTALVQIKIDNVTRTLNETSVPPPLTAAHNAQVSPETGAFVDAVSRRSAPTNELHGLEDNAANRIAKYCASLGKLAGGSYQIEAACHEEEQAALHRLGANGALRDVDAQTYRYCTTAPFNQSYSMMEACITSENEAKASLASATDATPVPAGADTREEPTSNGDTQTVKATAETSQRPVRPGDFLGFGSRVGMDVTVYSTEGLGSTSATIAGKLTITNAKHFCIEYSSDKSQRCIDQYMNDTRLADSIAANCDTGVFSTFYGGHLQFMGPGDPDSLASYKVKNLDDDSTLDGTSASGFPQAMEQFNALCPGAAARSQRL